MKNKLADLFITFARVGICTFGGGYAIIPILEREIVNKKGWTSQEEIMDYYVVGQCTPGVIAVNTATFIGRKIGGIAGGFIATLGLVFPSYVIICLISAVLQSFADLAAVQHAFSGIRIAVCALVITTVAGMIKKGVKNALCAIILLGAFTAVAFFGVSPAIIVLICGILGVFFGKAPEKKSESDKPISNISKEDNSNESN